MKPRLYEVTDPQGRRNGWIVDVESEFTAEGIHYATAVALGEAKAGQVTFDFKPNANGTSSGVLVNPLPCVIEIKSRRFLKKENNLAARGFTPDAAKVLLELTAEAQGVSVSWYPKPDWKWNIKAADPAWVWKWIAAVKWSAWQKLKYTREQRYDDMKTLGYPLTQGALYQTCRRLGLRALKRL
jgi:hypothetical protein